MRRRGVILAVLFTSGSVLAQAPVGPSTAILDGTRFGLSAEYGQADADIRFEDGSKENFDFQTAYANFAAILTSRWDFFVRVGASQAQDPGFEGDWEFSWGLGTRFTVVQWHDFGWGVMGQLTNLISRTDTRAVVDGNDIPVTEELSLMEYIFATGPTWRHGPVSLYGGLLVRLVDGEFEVFDHRFEVQADIDTRWDVGGYVGGQLTLFQANPALTNGINRCDLSAEGRFTDDSTAFSVGLRLLFGGEY